jgi:hypothetical protein
MAKVKIQGHASGTGILTVTAPNTSTDRTITLPDATGTLLNSDGDGSNLTGINAIDGTDLTIVTGDIVFGTAGKGICLGVTSNTDGNTLDDYEEGTWTPAISTGTMVASGGRNTYTKIGRLVTLNGYFNITTVTDASNITIAGLPFVAPSSGYNSTGIVQTGAASTTKAVITRTESSASHLILYYSGTQSTPPQTEIWSHILFTHTYETP